MLETLARMRRVTHPTPESLIPLALGADDAATARHVAACATCRAEVEALQETAGLVRGFAAFEHRIETPDCLDELVVADFVEGRLSGEARAPVVAHLLSCARCRALVKATAAAPPAAGLTSPRLGRWSVPLGLAAAAAIVLLLLPRVADDGPLGLREPMGTSTITPVPLAPAPNASVSSLDRLVWSSVPKAERYRVRLYDPNGSTLWSAETADTAVALPDSVRLTARVPYFWRVEAQAEFQRWAASDLVSFQLVGPRQ